MVALAREQGAYLSAQLKPAAERSAAERDRDIGLSCTPMARAAIRSAPSLPRAASVLLLEATCGAEFSGIHHVWCVELFDLDRARREALLH